MAAIQKEVLDRAASAVKPGGVLVYATCSVFAAEDEEVVRDFLGDHPEFQPEGFPDPLSGEETAGAVLFNGAPQGADCMFAARFRRAGAQ